MSSAVTSTLQVLLFLLGEEVTATTLTQSRRAEALCCLLVTGSVDGQLIHRFPRSKYSSLLSSQS